MKKNYAKLLVSAFVAATSIFGAQADEVVVLQENFDKLEAATSNGVHKYGKNPWTGTDADGVSYQPNYTNLVTAGEAEDLNGWSSRTGYLYTCYGFVRISKTNYGGDLLSPKFTALTEATDVKLYWQGIGYSSVQTLDSVGNYKSGLVHDYQYYCVAVLGAGEIEGASRTMTVKYKDEYNNDLSVPAAVIEIPTNCFITPDTTEAWSFEGTKNTLTIKGATAETQVAFMSTFPATKTTNYATTDMPIATDAPHGTNVKVNRVIFDNIKVVTVGNTAVENINADKVVKARKVIENGQVYIVAGDKKYNVMGVEVK